MALTGRSALVSAARRTFPGNGPSALVRQGRMVLAGLRSYPLTQALLAPPPGTALDRIMRQRPELIGSLLDAGVEMPMIDVLYQGAVGNLTQNVSGGAVVGESVIDGVACDHLAFRQSNVDWQLWVQKGEQALPRKIVITTRFEVGDPQYQVTMHWNLKPKVSDATFKFTAPANASEVSLMAGDTSK